MKNCRGKTEPGHHSVLNGTHSSVPLSLLFPPHLSPVFSAKTDTNNLSDIRF